MLEIRNLCKSYSYAETRQDVLRQLAFGMAASSSVALLGHSGSGKSTLLHLIAGLDRPDSGEIVFDGHRMHAESESDLASIRRSSLSLVFQQFHLISTLTVLDNVRFQAALCQRLNPHYEAELIDRLELRDQLPKFPHQLSRAHYCTSRSWYCRMELDVFRGHEVKTTGDGFHATFDGPARAVQCANAIRQSTRQLGLSLSIGIHTGECEIRGDSLEGVAIHMAARVSGMAAGGEILVSRTIKDLVAGSGIEFEDFGTHILKGIPDEHQIFKVISA